MSLLLTTPHVSAQIIWSADPNQSTKVGDFFKRFDDGNYPQDYCVSKGDEAGVTPSSVSVVTDPEFGKVWQINKPKNRKRGEFARFEGLVNSLSPKEGDDIYIAWKWKIDTQDGAQIDKEITVFQWKSASPHNQNYPLNMEYDGDLTLNAFGADYEGKVGQFARRAVLWRQPVPQNEWVSFVVHIKVDKDDFGGLVRFWFNGEQQELDNLQSKKYRVKLSDDHKTVYHRTNDGRFVYPKWGAYNKKSCHYNVNAYFHDMKVGTTLSSVLPE
nr:heparin lyase I family protein [Neiella litorisoli]